ncbi:MAG: type-4 uracil-DNA glycosylase [Desulfurococcaceae archaeon]
MSADEWDKLLAEIEACTRCRLHASRRRVVPGQGNKMAPAMLVGEAPGEKEDERGEPFVGSAGRLLTELIEDIGFKREDFYITNVVKCRPPGNRAPEEDEVEACSRFLLRQIELIKPKVVIALGRHSSRTLFRLAGLKWISMSANHGRSYKSSILGTEIKIIPTYHPASALYNPGLKKILEEDFRGVIKSAVEEAIMSSKRKRYKTLFDFVNNDELIFTARDVKQ